MNRLYEYSNKLNRSADSCTLSLIYCRFYFQHHSQTRGAYRAYDADELTRAYDAVQEGSFSIRKAAVTYGVPKTTLIDWIHGRISVDVVKSGTPTLFSEEQEALLAGHVQTRLKLGMDTAGKRLLI